MKSLHHARVAHMLVMIEYPGNSPHTCYYIALYSHEGKYYRGNMKSPGNTRFELRRVPARCPARHFSETAFGLTIYYFDGELSDFIPPYATIMFNSAITATIT